MLSTIAKFALAAAVLVLFVPGADAQRVPARCAKAKDKVKCTCGVENGAVFVNRPGGGRRMIIRQGGASTNDGYARCLLRHGRS
ncbi:MAG: hypothetical protein K2Y71_03680 [Xanthobacteraceae bacterium]|nr:hypothetical protein [Xanthobacteraceae bacterium]